MNADVPKPYIPPQTMNPFASPFRSGELLGYYWDWQILDSGQVEFTSDSAAFPIERRWTWLLRGSPLTSRIDPLPPRSAHRDLLRRR